MKILVVFKSSPKGYQTLRIALQHAKAFGAKVYLVQSWKDGHDQSRRDVEDAEREMNWVCQDFIKEGVPCECHVLVRGLSPGENIVQFARENAIDEIVIGVKRMSRVGKAVFGSTAQHVILNAPCPVMTVK